MFGYGLVTGLIIGAFVVKVLWSLSISVERQKNQEIRNLVKKNNRSD